MPSNPNSNGDSVSLLEQAVRAQVEKQRPVSATPTPDKFQAPATVPLLSRSQRKLIDVPVDEAHQGLQSGELVIDPQSTYQVIDPDTSESKQVVGNELDHAIQKGYTFDHPDLADHRKQLADQQELRDDMSDRPWGVGTMSALDDVAFGIPRHLMSPEMQERFDVGKEENPWASGIGSAVGIGAGILAGSEAVGAGTEGLGALASKFIPGAEKLGSLASGVGRGVEAGFSGPARPAGTLANIASKAVTTAAKYGTENVLYELPRAATEAAFGDPEKAGEQLAMAGVIGGGIGALVGGPGTGISKLVRGINERITSKVESAAQRTMDAADAKASTIGDVGTSLHSETSVKNVSNDFTNSKTEFAQDQNKSEKKVYDGFSDVTEQHFPTVDQKAPPDIQSKQYAEAAQDLRSKARSEILEDDAIRGVGIPVDNVKNTVAGIGRDVHQRPWNGRRSSFGRDIGENPFGSERPSDANVASSSTNEGEKFQGTIPEGSETPQSEINSEHGLVDDDMVKGELNTHEAPGRQGDMEFFENQMAPGSKSRAADDERARKLGEEFGLSLPNGTPSSLTDKGVSDQKLVSENVIKEFRDKHDDALDKIANRGILREDRPSMAIYDSLEPELGSRKTNMDVDQMSKSQKAKHDSLTGDATSLHSETSVRSQRYDDLERKAAIERKTPFSSRHDGPYRNWLESLQPEQRLAAVEYTGPTFDRLKSVEERLSQIKKFTTEMPEPKITNVPEKAELDLVTPPDRQRMAEDQRVRRQRQIDEHKARIAKMPAQPKITPQGKVQMVIPVSDVQHYAEELGAKSDQMYNDLFGTSWEKHGELMDQVNKDIVDKTESKFLEQLDAATAERHARFDSVRAKLDDNIQAERVADESVTAPNDTYDSQIPTRSEWEATEAKRPKSMEPNEFRDLQSKSRKGTATAEELARYKNYLNVEMMDRKFPKGDYKQPHDLEQLEKKIESDRQFDQHVNRVQKMRNRAKVAFENINDEAFSKHDADFQDHVSDAKRSDAPDEWIHDQQKLYDMTKKHLQESGLDQTTVDRIMNGFIKARKDSMFELEQHAQELSDNLENELKVKQPVAAATSPSRLSNVARMSRSASVADMLADQKAKQADNAVNAAKLAHDVHDVIHVAMGHAWYPAMKHGFKAAIKRMTRYAAEDRAGMKLTNDQVKLVHPKGMLGFVDGMTMLAIKAMDSNFMNSRLSNDARRFSVNELSRSQDPRQSAMEIGERMQLASQNMGDSSPLSKTIQLDAPNIANAHDQVIKRVINTLASKAPKKSIDPVDGDQLPTRKDSERYMKWVGAAFEPQMMNQKIKRGTVTPEDVKAFSTLWPNAWNTIVENMVQGKQPKTSAEKHSWSIVAGQPRAIAQRRRTVESVMQWGGSGQTGASQGTVGSGSASSPSRAPVQSTLADRLQQKR